MVVVDMAVIPQVLALVHDQATCVELRGRICKVAPTKNLRIGFANSIKDRPTRGAR